MGFRHFFIVVGFFLLSFRRLVTNILLSFLMTSRGDPKRFEMLSLLATILSWDDAEREKAGLQRQAAAGGGSKGKASASKGKETEKSAEEEAAMNEVSQSAHEFAACS